MSTIINGTSSAITFPDSTVQNSAGLTSSSGLNATNLTSGTLPTARLPAGSVLKVQQFTDAGSATTSGSVVNLNAVGFSYTPVSTNSTLYITVSFYAINTANTAGGLGAGGVYGFYNTGEFNGSVYVAFGNTGYLWNYQYSTTYAQQIGTQITLLSSRSNSSLTTRSFDLMGATSNASSSFSGAQIVMQIIEVAN